LGEFLHKTLEPKTAKKIDKRARFCFGATSPEKVARRLGELLPYVRAMIEYDRDWANPGPHDHSTTGGRSE
jgi:hypothetical protein